MLGSMQKVKSLAYSVKTKGQDIKDWMESFDELGTKVNKEIKETWKVVLKDWQMCLKTAKDGTEQVRSELNIAIKQVLDMRSTIEGMSATAGLNANKHMDEMKNEYNQA